MATKRKKGKVKKNYPAHKIEGRDLSNTVFQKWIQAAIDLMHEGWSTSYIREYITKNKEGSVAVSTIDTIMSHANEKIVLSQFVKDYEVTAIHLRRYNRQIKELLATQELPYPTAEDFENNPYAYQDWAESRKKKIRAYNDAINTIVQKEDLLKLHDGLVIDWNTEEIIEIKDKKPKINITKLTLQEQVELYHMIKKARKDDFELVGVIQGAGEAKDETIDVEAEVVEEKPNIDSIEQLPIPSEAYISPVTAADPTIKLRETLRKLAAKKIEEVGGKLTDEEKQILNQKF